MSRRTINMIEREFRRNPLQTNREEFKGAGIPGMPKAMPCPMLNKLKKCGKAEIRTPLKGSREENGYEKAQVGKEIHETEFCLRSGDSYV